MGTAIMHRMPGRVKPSFVIFDIRALWRSGLSVRVPGCQKRVNMLRFYSLSNRKSIGYSPLSYCALF